MNILKREAIPSEYLGQFYEALSGVNDNSHCVVVYRDVMIHVDFDEWEKFDYYFVATELRQAKLYNQTVVA